MRVVRPVLARHAFAEDHDSWGIGAVLVRNRASQANGQLHRLEVVAAHGANTGPQFTVAEFGPSFDGEPVRVSLVRVRAGDPHTGKRAQRTQHPVVERGRLRGLAVLLLGENDVHRQEPLWIEPRTSREEPLERLDHKSGADQQDQGQGHFDHYERAPCAAAAGHRGGAAATFLERFGEVAGRVCPQCQQNGRQAAQHRGQYRYC